MMRFAVNVMLKATMRCLGVLAEELSKVNWSSKNLIKRVKGKST